MSYALLWVEVLVILLLFAATLTALGAQRSGRLARGLFMGIGIALPAALLLLVLFMSLLPWVLTGEMTRWAPVLAALVLAYCLGALVVRMAGRRPDAITGESRVRSWSPGNLGLAMLVAVAVLLMTLWNMDVQAQLAIQSTRTEAGAIAASVAPPPVPDQQNAALVYEQAFALLPPKEVWDNLTAIDPKADPLSPEVQKLLQEQAKTIELLRRAADMPGCRFEYDYAHPDMGALMAELPNLRKGAMLLACAARSEAAHGNIPAALEDCGRVYRIGQHAAANPSMVTFLVELGIHHLANMAVAQALPRVTDAQQLKALPEQGNLARAARRSLRGEEALGLAMLCDWAAGSDPTAILPEASASNLPGRLPSFGMFGRIFLLPTEIREYSAAFGRMTERVGMPYYQAPAGPDEPQQTKGIMARILVPSLESYRRSIARAQAVDECRRVAVAATQYRLEHQAYPADLGQLVPKYLPAPALPLDPFDGKPLRMKSTEAGLVIYSIGDDGKDDGGAIQSEDRKAVDYGLLLANRP